MPAGAGARGCSGCAVTFILLSGDPAVLYLCRAGAAPTPNKFFHRAALRLPRLYPGAESGGGAGSQELRYESMGPAARGGQGGGVP